MTNRKLSIGSLLLWLLSILSCSVVSPITDRSITPEIELNDISIDTKFGLNVAVINMSDTYVYERIVFTGWKTNDKPNQANHRCNIGDSVSSFLQANMPSFFENAELYSSTHNQLELMQQYDALLLVSIEEVETSDIRECSVAFKKQYKPCCGVSSIRLSFKIKDKMGEILFETTEKAYKEGVIYTAAKYCKKAKIYLTDMRKFDNLISKACSENFTKAVNKMRQSIELQAYERFINSQKLN